MNTKTAQARPELQRTAAVAEPSRSAFEFASRCGFNRSITLFRHFVSIRQGSPVYRSRMNTKTAQARPELQRTAAVAEPSRSAFEFASRCGLLVRRRLPQSYAAAGLRPSRGPFITKKCWISAGLVVCYFLWRIEADSPSNSGC
jgi:hypothetical protein